MVCAHWLACGYHLVVILESSTVSLGKLGGQVEVRRAWTHWLALQAPHKGYSGEQHSKPGGFYEVRGNGW